MTGGLQEQVHDEDKWFGIGIEPASRAVIGSLQVPYIYEDRVSKQDFHQALSKMFAMSREQRSNLGLEGRKHVEKNYNFDKFKTSWIELFDSVVANHGSWETRKGYNSWQITEIK